MVYVGRLQTDSGQGSLLTSSHRVLGAASSAGSAPHSHRATKCRPREEAEGLVLGAEGVEGAEEVPDAADAAVVLGRRSPNPSSECRRRSGGRMLLSGWRKSLQQTLAADGTP
jgi:hypothetical protein